MACAPVTTQRLQNSYQTVRSALLAERTVQGIWTGQLSTSALSTATAVMALEMVRRSRSAPRESRGAEYIRGGLRWLAEHQNADGGWGDTTKSISNISTTMLARASFHAAGRDDEYRTVVDSAEGYIERAGGVEAVVRRYGKDRTFSAPILTHCALAGLVDWSEVIPLPFELACLPARFYSTVRLPVVSYALPALIAVGQVRHHHLPPRNPAFRLLRDRAVGPSLRVLQRIQPTNGGFLEATPLTSFVTMSLAGMGRADHPVARKGVEFLLDSVRQDGSWPIDTNLATWVTTLSVNALGDDLPAEDRPAIRDWLLDQQYREVHPYTNAAPGGWAWTDLPGGVPDADDTPGAILALLGLSESSPRGAARGLGVATRGLGVATRGLGVATRGLGVAIRWLLHLQNRDGGWPTFCRGWGTLPFDRSAPDLTAHNLRALHAWQKSCLHGSGERPPSVPPSQRGRSVARAIDRGFRYLARTQRADGSWLPLWFGNQYAPDDENPVYGTARVLAAYRDTGQMDSPPARRGLQWVRGVQNPDGGWGGAAGVESSVEETALGVEILLSEAAYRDDDPTLQRGLQWLISRVEDGSFREASPIGFYFAKLWYFEHLYPLIFTTAALRRACLAVEDRTAVEAASDAAVSKRSEDSLSPLGRGPG